MLPIRKKEIHFVEMSNEIHELQALDANSFEEAQKLDEMTDICDTIIARASDPSWVLFSAISRFESDSIIRANVIKKCSKAKTMPYEKPSKYNSQ
jgi:hypothetical protein